MIAAPGIVSVKKLNQIEYAAMQALRSTQYSALRDLECDYDKGTLTVLGALANFHLKQVAMHCLKSIPGVERICDRIVVDF
jgi:hypothetical protein